jgi:TetR/AcrR family transcriptional regulator, ethionamide resistance regulator
MLSERVMAATFTAEERAIPEDRVIDTLAHIWLASIYRDGNDIHERSVSTRSARATLASINRSTAPK